MAYVTPTGPPEAEVVSLPAMKNFLRVSPNVTTDDDLIQGLIVAASEYVETYTGKSLAKKGYLQVLDSFPYFTDTVMSQMAYPPSYYALPRYSTTLWNYSQMIKLFYPPLIPDANLKIVCVGTDGNETTILPGRDFQVDPVSMPARLFPLPGQTWPPVLYAANAARIYFTAGFEVESTENPPPDFGTVTEPEVESIAGNAPNPPQQVVSYTLDRTIPQTLVMAVRQLVVHWYQNRDAVITGAGAGGKHETLPLHVQALLDSERFIDFAPTRG